MGILHDLLAKLHLVRENAQQLADPEAAEAKAHSSFLSEAADVIHGLEARVKALEESLFGLKPTEAQPEVAQNTGSAVAPEAPTSPASNGAVPPAAADSATQSAA